jgi:hypothetical protein
MEDYALLELFDDQLFATRLLLHLFEHDFVLLLHHLVIVDQAVYLRLQIDTFCFESGKKSTKTRTKLEKRERAR